MDIIETIEKYNLTLRHLPETVSSFHIAKGKELDYHNLKENQELVEWDNWKDCITRIMVKETRVRKGPAWICYITPNWDSIVPWTRNFRGATPEEAVNQAVEYIKITLNTFYHE